MSRVHILQPIKKKPGWKPRSPVVILVEPPDFGQEVARTRLGPPPQAYLSSLAVGPLNCLSSQSWSQVEVVLSDRGLLLLLWKFWPCSATRQSKVGSYLKTDSACTVVVTSCLFYRETWTHSFLLSLLPSFSRLLSNLIPNFNLRLPIYNPASLYSYSSMILHCRSQ